MEEKVKKIIAAYTPFNYEQIDLNVEIKDNYVAAAFKDNLANDFCIAWPNVNCTMLHNQLFVTLKTGKDLISILQFVNQ